MASKREADLQGEALAGEIVDNGDRPDISTICYSRHFADALRLAFLALCTPVTQSDDVRGREPAPKDSTTSNAAKAPRQSAVAHEWLTAIEATG